MSETQIRLSYHGAADQVELIGDLNCWTRGIHIFSQIAVQQWELILTLHSQTRSAYQLLIDGQAQLDSANPHTLTNSHGLCSELRLPEFVDAPSLPAPTGERRLYQLGSDILANTYELIVYRVHIPPPDGYALILCYDGAEAERLLNLPSTLDYLVEQQMIPPVICLMLPPRDRLREYNNNQDYRQHVIYEVLPLIESQYSITRQPERRLIMGMSMGASASAALALHHSDQFGLVLAQSGIYAIDAEAIIRQYRDQERLLLRFYVTCGQYESCFVGGKHFGATLDVLTANRHFAAMLAEKEYAYRYVEPADGHAWRMWQLQLIPALRWLFQHESSA